jgi:hypothetical protein
VDGAASLDIQAGFGTSYLGDVVFQARFKRGSTNFENSESDPSDTVTFVRAPATAAIVSITAATDGKVGDDVTLVASVAGSNGFDPAGGSVEFNVRPSTASIGNAAIIGTAQSLAFDSVSGQWRATLTYTTGADSTPLESAGAYLFTAHFSQTATLAADVSNDFAFTLTPQDPTITVTLPNSGTITTGDSPAVVRVVLTTSGRASRLDDNCPSGQGGSSCGDIELLGTGGTTAPSGPVVELETGVWGREFSVSGLDAGTYSISAHYTGNTYFNEVTSGSQTLTVNKKTVAVTVSATSPMTVNATQNLSASVSPTAAPGTIQFKVNGTAHGSAVTLSGGAASIPWTPTSVGSFSITAEYISSSVNYASQTTSNTVAVTVNAITTSITVSAPSPREYGQETTLTATVTPSGAPGTVQFKLNGVNFGSPASVTNGTATIQWTPSGTGTVALTASYLSGSTNYLSDPDSNSVSIVVNPATVTVTVSASSPVTVNTAQTLNVSVSPAAAPGTIQFKVGGTAHGAVQTLSSGSASVAWTPTSTGTFNITAEYTSTSQNYASQPVSNTVAVTVDPISVTVSVSAAGSVTLGNPITLTATLSPTVAPGTVRFFADGVDVSGAVAADTSDGITTYNWSPSSIGDGTATITATYTSSDGDYASQPTSTSTNVTINPAPATLVATAVQTGAAGSSLTFTADLTSAFGAKTDIDGGTVTFSISGSACTGMAAATVTDGVATLTGVVCDAGTRQVTATYTGSGNYAASEDSTNFQIVVA